MKIKKNSKAFEKLMKLCNKPIKNMTKKEYMKLVEDV